MLDFQVTIACIVNESPIKSGEEIVVYCDKTRDVRPKEENNNKN